MSDKRWRNRNGWLLAGLTPVLALAANGGTLPPELKD